MKINSLILAGGVGSRLRPLTETTPKCLVTVGEKPLLEFWLDAVFQAGIGKAVVNTHHLADQVHQFLKRYSEQRGVEVEASYEVELLGSAGTVTANRELADDAEAVLLIYADNFSEVDLTGLLEFHCNHDDPFTMLLFRTGNPSACGIATLDAAARIADFVEKPTEPHSDLANAGVYVVDAEAYREIADMRGFDLGFDVLPKFVGRMRGWQIEGFHQDVGSLESLAQVRDYYANRAAFPQS